MDRSAARAAWRVGLSVALAGSVAASAVLFRAGRAYYAAEQAVRLDPAGLGVYEAARKTGREHPERPLVVLFGDSRIAMWPPLAIDGFETQNRGVGNQTTAQARIRFDVDVAPARPSVVVLELGVNDLKTIPLFSARREEIEHDCVENVREIVRRSRALGARVVLLTVFSLGDVPAWRRLLWDPSPVAAAIVRVNESLRALAGEGVTVLDGAAILDGPPGTVRSPFQLDFLHESPAAYAALSDRVGTEIRALPAGR